MQKKKSEQTEGRVRERERERERESCESVCKRVAACVRVFIQDYKKGEGS